MLMQFDNFLSRADLSNPAKLEIETSKWTNVHPAGLVFAAALATVAGKENSTIDAIKSDSNKYLARMGLYDYLATPKPRNYNEKEESGRFIPIRNIKTSTEQSQFIADMIPLLHLDPERSAAIKYVIGELLRNVIEHANAKNGAFVAAQYYARKNKISIGICDAGIGLKSSLDRYHSPRDDLDAIRYALMPGISGTTFREGGTEDNAGAGLFVIKSMAKITRDYFVIYSGDSEYKLLKYDSRVKYGPRIYADPFDDRHSTRDNLPNFDGTLVGLDITLDDTMEFNELLEGIKKVYSRAVRERKTKVYRKPKYV
jgi:anti-sigma regulatory factor (Ser/Thr protein kinase)